MVSMNSVVQQLARTDDLSEQTDLLGRLQHELFHTRCATQRQGLDVAGQCVSAARVIIFQLSAFLGSEDLPGSFDVGCLPTQAKCY
jgi:hypothetical protein